MCPELVEAGEGSLPHRWQRAEFGVAAAGRAKLGIAVLRGANVRDEQLAALAASPWQ